VYAYKALGDRLPLFTNCPEEVFSETDQTGAKAIVSIKSVSRAEPVIASVRGQL
jgi:hypothetical protein